MSTDPIFPPGLDDLETLGAETLATIPEFLRRHVEDLIIRVEDFPDEEIEAAMEIESPFDLLGLYRGVTRAGRESGHSAPLVDMIFLYRRPILDYWCETGDDLAAIVRHVLIHEIGHHFGFSDEDMARLDAEEEIEADTEELD
jgi:predicted Zn-dependent protease with MMP-like domain